MNIKPLQLTAQVFLIQRLVQRSAPQQVRHKPQVLPVRQARTSLDLHLFTPIPLNTRWLVDQIPQPALALSSALKAQQLPLLEIR